MLGGTTKTDNAGAIAPQHTSKQQTQSKLREYARMIRMSIEGLSVPNCGVRWPPPYPPM